MTEPLKNLDYNEKSRQYVEEGFCVIEQVLAKDFLKQMQDLCNEHLKTVSDEHRSKQVSTGSLIDLSNIPQIAKLIANPDALEAYKKMGFEDTRYTNGYLISKPPKSPPLFWHFDWMGWHHPISYEKGPLQTFFMYYLVDTTIENGCLKVIPRSHLEEHPLHDMMRNAHTADLSQAKDLNAKEFASHPDEVNVCVKAGDLVIGDSRLIHGSHPNNSDQERPVITIWMHPNFSQMPEELQAWWTNCQNHEDWPAESQGILKPMRPDYTGETQALKTSRLRPKPEEVK